MKEKFCLRNSKSLPLESRIQLKDSGIKLTIGIDKDVNPVPGIQGVQSRIQDCPGFPYTGRKIGSLLTSTLKSILFIQSCQSVASTMEIKSAGTFSVILVKVATPLLPSRTKLNFVQMGGNGWVFFGHGIAWRGSGTTGWAQSRSKNSLPADVLWGSIVTHSFLPHRQSVGEKWMRDKRTPKDVCGEANQKIDTTSSSFVLHKQRPSSLASKNICVDCLS